MKRTLDFAGKNLYEQNLEKKNRECDTYFFQCSNVDI